MEEGAWELCPLYYLLSLSVNLKVILKKKRPINKKRGREKAVQPTFPARVTIVS